MGRSPVPIECFDEGFLSRNSISWGPGGDTLLNVGFGMYSLITLRRAIFVRPLTWTYFTRPSYSARQVLGERIRRLVHVVVGVEHRVAEIVGQGALLTSCMIKIL